MMKTSRILSLGFAAAIAACAGNGPAPASVDVRAQPLHVETGGGRPLEITREKQVTSALTDVPMADAWSRLLAIYPGLGIPDADLAVDPAHHTVGITDRRTGRLAGRRMSQYLDCGYSLGTPKADQGQVYVTLQTTLLPAEGGTTVRTRLQAMAKTSGVSTEPIACSSKGEIERHILEQLTGADTP